MVEVRQPEASHNMMTYNDYYLSKTSAQLQHMQQASAQRLTAAIACVHAAADALTRLHNSPCTTPSVELANAVADLQYTSATLREVEVTDARLRAAALARAVALAEAC